MYSTLAVAMLLNTSGGRCCLLLAILVSDICDKNSSTKHRLSGNRVCLGSYLLIVPFGAAQIPVWYKWVYWGVNPISYAQTGMAIIEFGAPRWQAIVLPDGRTLGNTILDARQARRIHSTHL